MIDERTAHDIQAEVDGENTPDVSRRVHDLIVRDPEAAALYEQLRTLAAQLAAVSPEAPPEVLRSTVTGAVAWRSKAPEKSGAPHQPSRSVQGTSMREPKREGAMKGKYVIAGLVAAGAAGIILWVGGIFPPRNDEAAGTIGAVKKHHVEQIAEGDVVLGAKAADADWVPFADFLGDAGALGAASSRLDAINKTLAAKDTFDAKTLAAKLNAIDAILEARAAQLQARTLESLRLQAKQLESAIQAKSDLDSKRLDSKQLEAKQLEAKQLDSKRLEAMRLEAKELGAKLQARDADIVGVHTQLAALTRELAAASNLDARTLELAAKLDARNDANLGVISAALAARDVDLAARVLAARDSYIESAFAPQADLVGARTELAAINHTLEASSHLDAKSLESMNALCAKLQARSAELEQRGLVGMRDQLAAAARDFDALMGMKANVDLASSSKLGSIKNDLGVKTLDASTRLAAFSRSDIGSFEQTLGARDAAFGAKTLAAMNTELANLNQVLQQRASQLGAKQLEAMQTQLGSVNQTLQARTPEVQ